MKEIELYRALAVGETELVCASPLPEDLLSVCCSRVISSSGLVSPFLRCFTEDPRIALKYSRQKGYSGEIAKLTVVIEDNGTCQIADYTGKQYGHRLWLAEDYIDLFSRENLNKITNMNTGTPLKPTSIVSYVRNTPHGYSHRMRTWLINTESPYKYTHLLTNQEKSRIECLKSFKVPSLHQISYNSRNTFAIDYLLSAYAEFDGNTKLKRWYKNTVRDLESIKQKYAA
ncbi:MAG: hypothetical protein IKZ29_09335 [Clostridiales bacterium]|nr:hypothetical protein [Clostridiales bacterium]